MKRIFLSIAVIVFALLLAMGCRSHKDIPPEKLEMLFREFFLANAYMETQGNSERDSLDVYRPILKKYGYAMSDLTYTFDNMSKRKSMKMSDVVDNTVKALQAEHEALRMDAAGRDSLEAYARRLFSRVIMSDSSIHVNSIKDTSMLVVTVPAESGSYRISYSYYIDSLDLNRGLRMNIQTINRFGRISDTKTSSMSAKRHNRYSTTMEVHGADTALRITFGNYKANMTRPNISIDSLRIVYLPPKEVAFDSLYYLWGGQNHNLYEHFVLFDPGYPQDSVALYPIPPEVNP